MIVQTLLHKSGEESMEIRRIKTLAIEIFKTVNELIPNFMKNIFMCKTNSRVRPFEILKNMVTKVSWCRGEKYRMHYLKM